MQCQFCGRPVQAGSYFCSVCGVYKPNQNLVKFSDDSVRLALNGVVYRHLNFRQSVVFFLTGMDFAKLYALYFTADRVAAINTNNSKTMGAIPELCNPSFDRPFDLPLDDMIMNNRGSFEIKYSDMQKVSAGSKFPGAIHEDMKRLEISTKQGGDHLFGINGFQSRVLKETSPMLPSLGLKILSD